MPSIEIRDVVDEAGWRTIPPCADAAFDHRTCNYWEDEVRGSKAHRTSWLEGAPAAPTAAANRLSGNPFAPTTGPGFNPFATSGGVPLRATLFGDDEEPELDNPFTPRPPQRPGAALGAPRKVQLLDRGLAVFGSYAKVLELDGEPAAFCQFGPLSAYPRARHVRDLYPQLPVSPLPAVITCIATTTEARGRGLAGRLVDAVTADLAGRGFAAVEAYPEPEMDPDATSAANPAFWLACGFDLAVDDPRYPVVRLELA